MKAAATDTTNLASKVGTWMFLCWFFVLGPVGLLLLGGIAYAMYFSNLALGIVCGLVLFAPLFLVIAWIPLIGAKLMEEKVLRGEAVAAEVDTAS